MKNKSTLKKKITVWCLLAIIFATAFALQLCGCASCARTCKSWDSEISNGLDRTVNIYSYDGKLLATYEGQIDLQENESKVLFDLNGKRYVYYNAVVEVIEN